MSLHKTTVRLLAVIANNPDDKPIQWLYELTQAIAEYREANCPDTNVEPLLEHDVFKDATGYFGFLFCKTYGHDGLCDPSITSERHWQMQVLEASRVFQDKCEQTIDEVSLELFDGQYAVYVDPVLDGINE